MASNVYANMMAVSCKAAAGKTICAFPDVCMTPPMTPATPPGVPIPYPNTGMASDTSSGSSSVKIGGQEVMLKNKSFFKRSTGDEAGAAPKKGVVTSKTMGKVYFNSWSMDVKVEGENVPRHLDLTTHNHASPPGQTPPMPEVDGMSPGVITIECDPAWSPCQKQQAKTKVDEMNKMTPLKRKLGISAVDSTGSSTREVGNAFAKGFKSHAKAMRQGKASRSEWIKKRTAPKGDGSDLMHPCMEQELKKNPKAFDKWSADHLQDLQFGGDVGGPFKMLDRKVNESLGRQMSRGPSVVNRFEHKGCD
jgi:hypothetical protein